MTKVDVKCRGSTVDILGEIHDNVLTYDTTSVLIITKNYQLAVKLEVCLLTG